MKETSFIEQNKSKWQRFEQLSDSQTKDPEELSELYLDITDDLSYAQTFYRRRTVRVYLNQLAQRVYTGLHIQKGESFKKVLSVWKTSLPLELYRSQKTILFTFAVFIMWVTIGAVSTHFNPDFAKMVMGEGYISLTDSNIASGNPLAIYGQTESQLQMFISITTNNLKVAFYAFILGAFFTIGTHIILFANGIMLGAFQYYFATKGILITTFLGIWIHGAFEISAIVLSGAAGIILGTGYLFPGNYTRLQSLQLSAKRGLKIMLSLVPFIILAGFLESYVTRNYQNLPDWSKWTLIGLSFGIILLYYVIYPIIVARKNPHLVHQEEVVNYFPKLSFDVQRIRTFGQILSDTFRFYRMHIGTILKLNRVLILPMLLLVAVFQGFNHMEWMRQQHFFDWVTQLEIMIGYGFHNWFDVLAVICWSFFANGMLLNVLFVFAERERPFSWSAVRTFYGKHFWPAWLANIALFLTISILPWSLLLLALFLIPLFYLNGVVAIIQPGKLKQKLGRGWKYSAQSYGSSLLSLFLMLAIFTLFMQPIAFVGSIYDNFDPNNMFQLSKPAYNDLLDLVSDFTKRIGQVLGLDFMYWSNLVRQLVYLLFFVAVFPLWIISIAFLAYNEHEKTTAAGLKKSFEQFGKRSRYQENEVDYE
jgi:uncharacterized membrane protein SpoIIM required for sporulation